MGFGSEEERQGGAIIPGVRVQKTISPSRANDKS